MSEEISAAHPPPAPQEQGHGAFKKGLVLSLLGLYAATALAALALLWRAPPKEPEKPPLFKRSRLLSMSMTQDKEVVGWVSIDGPIYASDGGAVWARGTQQWERRLKKLAEKKEVKAIVLAINSPGGSVGSVQELHSVILRVRKENRKPVVAHLGDVAASGGYYLAAACDKVVSQPGTLLGSIGVIFHHGDIQGLLKKIGVQSDVIKSGKMKDIGSMTRPMTAEEKDLLQALIDNAYGQFLHAVAEGRSLPEDRVRPLADGRIFTGQQALALGLVDQLGDAQDAVNLAGKLGGIKGKARILREGDSLSTMLELLESRWSLIRSPEAILFGRLSEFAYSGLEYRWSR